MSYQYDPNKDYMAEMNRYAATGDYYNAAIAEQARNDKIAGEGLTQYDPTYTYKAYLPGGESYHTPSDEYYQQWMNRPAFSFDVNNDELYNQYKDEYIRNGELAMRDTIGQQSGLTGGYSSTYALNAGQQAYNDYLQSLNDVIPDIYSLRRSEYDEESDTMYNRYEIAKESEEDKFSSLQGLITVAGYTPNETELHDAGMSRAEAEYFKSLYVPAETSKISYTPDADTPDADTSDDSRTWTDTTIKDDAKAYVDAHKNCYLDSRSVDAYLESLGLTDKQRYTWKAFAQSFGALEGRG